MKTVSWRWFPHVLGLVLASVPAAGAATGCNVQEDYFSDEFNAGGADPYNFPPPYRGVGAVRQFAASGVFTETAAFAKGKPVGYYSFPFSPSQVLTTNYSAPSAAAWPDNAPNPAGDRVDPLRISGPGTDFRKALNNPAPVPLVYSFDAGTKCKGPDGYKYDVYGEAYPKDQQWNIFTFLPDRFASFPFGGLATWSYRPIVAEVSVSAKDYQCQAVKSERSLLGNADDGKVEMQRAPAEADGTRFGQPNADKYLAWALIDPGAAVVRVGEEPDVLRQQEKISGTSVQKYGWYGQFIVAYIDGGYIPVEAGPTLGTADKAQQTKRMRTQRLYFPRSVVDDPNFPPGAGNWGRGYDVVQADRFSDGEAYSPVCELWSYTLPAAAAAPTVDELPKSEDEILAKAVPGSIEPARSSATPSPVTGLPSTAITPRYVFCLQAAPRL